MKLQPKRRGKITSRHSNLRRGNAKGTEKRSAAAISQAHFCARIFGETQLVLLRDPSAAEGDTSTQHTNGLGFLKVV